MQSNQQAKTKQRIFLSCVSREFKSYRLKLANQLAALAGEPYEIKVQEDFQQGGFTLLEALADYVRDGDLVVHVTGDLAGASPESEHERALLRYLGEPVSATCPGWSYTQWEYWLARRFERRVLVYRAAETAHRDCGWPIQQSDEDAARQQRHFAAMDRAGEHWKPITGSNALVREVFHDLGLELTRKINNLPFQSIGSA